MASADYTVVTPERVALEYDIAGIGSRGAAAIVDTLIQTVAMVVIVFGASAGLIAQRARLSDFGASSSNTGTIIIVGLITLVSFVITSGYFMFFEIVWSGQSPGKRLVGLRVVRENGYPIRPVDAVIRNVVRYVDWLPIAYGVGVVVMLLNGRARRLGDFASGTLVVREGSRRALPRFEFSPTLEEPTLALSAADATLIRDFLLRRTSMHPTARADIATRLALAISRQYHVPFDSDSSPEAFLERLSL